MARDPRQNSSAAAPAGLPAVAEAPTHDPQPEERALAALERQSRLELEEEAKAEANAQAEEKAEAEASVFGFFQNAIPISGRRGLWLEVLKQATLDLATPSTTCNCEVEIKDKNCKQRFKGESKHFARCAHFWRSEALRWFQVKRSERAGSFPWVCDLIGLRSARVQQRLRQLVFRWVAEQEVARRALEPPARASVPSYGRGENRIENQL